MPLDPLVKTFLDQMAAQPSPKISQLKSPDARAMFTALMQLIGPKDVPIGKVENIVMPGPGGDLSLRNYTPVAAGGDALPTLIFFHGGGFVIGDLDTHDGLCRILANEAGARVIAVDYRLAPEHKYPAAVEDAIAAMNWIEANASKLGVDANRLAVGGESAGGALAAILAQAASEKKKPKLVFQLLMFPVTQIGSETVSLREFAEGYFLERETLNWFFENYLPADADKSNPRISPLNATDFSGLPPAHVMLGGYDPLHDEGAQYAEKLRAAGVPVTVADYPDMVHTFIYFEGMLPQAHEALVAAANTLKAAFSS
jgi:acetyl esterase/lipase